jgi:hypothetical protein
MGPQVAPLIEYALGSTAGHGARIDAVSETQLTAPKAAVAGDAPDYAAMLAKAGAAADFDACEPPSPRQMSRSKNPALQAVCAVAP